MTSKSRKQHVHFEISLKKSNKNLSNDTNSMWYAAMNVVCVSKWVHLFNDVYLIMRAKNIYRSGNPVSGKVAITMHLPSQFSTKHCIPQVRQSSYSSDMELHNNSSLP
jgi:hypothetical protein